MYQLGAIVCALSKTYLCDHQFGLFSPKKSWCAWVWAASCLVFLFVINHRWVEQQIAITYPKWFNPPHIILVIMLFRMGCTEVDRVMCAHTLTHTYPLSHTHTQTYTPHHSERELHYVISPSTQFPSYWMKDYEKGEISLSFPLFSLHSDGLEFLPHCFFLLFNSPVGLFKPLSLFLSSLFVFLSLCPPSPPSFHRSLACSLSKVVNLPSRGPSQWNERA